MKGHYIPNPPPVRGEDSVRQSKIQVADLFARNENTALLVARGDGFCINRVFHATFWFSRRCRGGKPLFGSSLEGTLDFRRPRGGRIFIPRCFNFSELTTHIPVPREKGLARRWVPVVEF